MFNIFWKKYPECSNYLVSNTGYVWSLYANKHMSWSLKDGVYPHLNLSLENKKSKKFVHTIVLETFVGKRPEGFECRHLDGNAKNNHLSNLKWGTSKENKNDCRDHGTLGWGEKSSSAKLTNEEAAVIRGCDLDAKTLSLIYDISTVAINEIKRGLRYVEK